MKISVYKMFVLCFLLFFESCNKTDVYADHVKTIDSLNTVIHAMTNELRDIDTIFLKKSIARFNWYQEFIELNVNDTITKNEADHLDHFITSGQNLVNIEQNRQHILIQSHVMSSQLTKLSEDIKNKHLAKEELVRFTAYEKEEAEKIIIMGYRQQNLFHSSVEEFKTALKGVELLIRSRNNGELPTIVKDSISL